MAKREYHGSDGLVGEREEHVKKKTGQLARG